MKSPGTLKVEKITPTHAVNWAGLLYWACMAASGFAGSLLLVYGLTPPIKEIFLWSGALVLVSVFLVYYLRREKPKKEQKEYDEEFGWLGNLVLTVLVAPHSLIFIGAIVISVFLGFRERLVSILIKFFELF